MSTEPSNLSDPNRSALLSPPEEPDATDAEVVEHEWDVVDNEIDSLREVGAATEYPGTFGGIAMRIESSLQTIRELTEVRK